MERRTIETIKADTHDALDEVEHGLQAGGEKLGAGPEPAADSDETKRDVRDDDADGI